MGGYILWNNLADTATLSTTTSGTMLRPLTDLQIPRAKGLCRGPANGGSVAPATLTIRADLGSIQSIHGIALIGLNAVTYCSMAYQLSNTGFGLSDQGDGGAEWYTEYGNETGQSLFSFLPKTTEAQYVHIEIAVHGRPSGQRYVDVRRLLISNGTVFESGFDREWGILPVDPTLDVQTDAGGVFTTEHVPYREMQFAVTGRTNVEMKSGLILPPDYSHNLSYTMQKAGKRKELIVTPRTYSGFGDTFNNSLYCRFSEWSPIMHVGGNFYSCDSLRVKEIPHPPL